MAQTFQALTLALIFLTLSGCVHHPAKARYKALIYSKTTPSSLKILETTIISDISITGVTLNRAVGIFYVCNEYPVGFVNTITVEAHDKDWSEQLVKLTMKNQSSAEVYDAICTQTDSVWWADDCVHFAPKPSGDAARVVAVDKLRCEPARFVELAKNSAIVFVLHWNVSAQDYFVENIKGMPRPGNFTPPFMSWKELVARQPADPFTSGDPFALYNPVTMVVFVNTRPDSELYNAEFCGSYTSHSDNNIEVANALTELRKLKQ